MRPLLAPLALLALLAACKEETARAPEADPRAEAARAAAEEPLRARLRTAELQQRGVQVFPQAAPGQFAVCGRVTATQRMGEPLLPYVALVVFERNAPRVADLALGASANEAGRVYAEMVERCFEGGGSPNGRATARALPPLPGAGPGEALATQAALPAAQPAMCSVTTTSRHGVNIRSGPNGAGAIVRVAPRSTPLQVFAEGPGGWVQVGQDGTAWGWAHVSVLDGPPTRWVEGAAR